MLVEKQNQTEAETIKIMIVEDYKLTRIGLKSTLEEFSYIKMLCEADSGEHCMEMLKIYKPDIILMDLGLPGMNGLETTMKVKREYPDIKVIMLTSHEREEEVMASLGAGANGYCLKDVTPDALSDIIRAIYNGACFIDHNVAKWVMRSFPRPKNTDLSTFESQDGLKGQLTEREIEVLKLLVEGRSNTEIAKSLYVSVHTAKAHVCNILQKLCVDDRVQAAVKAIREELI